MKDQILNLLAAGLPQTTVATTVGCTPAYISQLLVEPQFAEKLKEKQTTAESERDARLDALEDKVIVKLEKSVDLLFKPMEVLKYFQVINQAKRSTFVPQTNQPSCVINLNLPPPVVGQFKLNIQNQVIEAGSQTLITATAAQLLQQIKKEPENEHSNKTELLPALE